MSAESSIPAEEVCLLARRTFDAGQRALWHIDKLGSLIDCSKPALGQNLELVYAIPASSAPSARRSTSVSSPSLVRMLPQSSSGEEFSLFSDSAGMSPRSPRWTSSPGMTKCKFLKITENTNIRVIYPTSVVVFTLDLSPSMNVVDTSFKSVSTGCHLVENLVHYLGVALRCLSTPASFSDQLTIQPDLIVTVIAHGIPALGVCPLLVGERVTESRIPGFVEKLNFAIRSPIGALSVWLQSNHVPEQLAGAASCSRNRNPCTSAVCEANDVSTVVRDALTALSVTCSQLGLSKAQVNKTVLILTDGVLAHPRKLPYDNILMHLNFVDVALHILQIGGGFAPWSALGYASDPDLLRLLAASTPTGIFLQDHHLHPILSAPACIGGNLLWRSSFGRISSVTAVRPGKARAATHMPYKAVTYQSSVLVALMGDPAGAGVGGSYIDHIQSSKASRHEHALRIQGIDIDAVGGLVGTDGRRSTSPSHMGRTRVPSVDSMQSLEGSADSDSDLEDAGKESAIQSLKSYLQPEKAKARPYLYKQYKLPGVTMAQLIQLRAKEGFLIESVSSSGGVKVAAQSNSVGGLARTVSSPSVHNAAASPSGVGGSSAGSGDKSSTKPSDIALSIHWGPVMDIIYEMSSSSSADPDSVADTSTSPSIVGEPYLSRLSDDVRVKIYLRMPSGEFFLRFKQQLAIASGNAATESAFAQMCRQLDAVVESIFGVDDTLAKITSPRLMQHFLHKSSSGALHGRRSVSDATTKSVVSHRISNIPSLERISERGVSSSSLGELSVAGDGPRRQSGEESSDAAMLREVIPKDVSSWHRWFSVRISVVLLDTEKSVAHLRVRHGVFGGLFVAAREALMDALRSSASVELDSNKFLFKFTAGEFESVKSDSAVANAFSRSNETLAARLSGDLRSPLIVTDPVNPMMFVEVGSRHDHCGLVKLTVGFFAMCPAMEKIAADSLTAKLTPLNASVVKAPSPIVRAIAQTGGACLGGASGSRKSNNAQPTPKGQVGMGTGDSFYTHEPSLAFVNRFMLHHAWDHACGPASIQNDVLTSIHEKRTGEGWKCVFESSNTVTYVKLNERVAERRECVRKGEEANAGTGKLWIPKSEEADCTYYSNIDESEDESTDSEMKDVNIDWDVLLKAGNVAADKFGNDSNVLTGACMCFTALYVHPRGEKPVLKCQLWVDRGEGDVDTQDGLVTLASALCNFD